MSMIRYDPFDALTPFREVVSRMIEEGMMGIGRFEPFGRVFPLDIRDTAGEYIVEAALPGIKPEELHVTVAGNTLTIQATRKREDMPEKAEKPETPEESEIYVRRERYVGEMNRVIELPTPIQASGVTATYEHGVLMVHAPKAAKVEPVKVPVQVKEPTVTH